MPALRPVLAVLIHAASLGAQEAMAENLPDPRQVAWWPMLELQAKAPDDPQVAWLAGLLRRLEAATRADKLWLDPIQRASLSADLLAAGPLQLRGYHPPRQQRWPRVLFQVDHARALPWGSRLAELGLGEVEPLDARPRLWRVGRLHAHALRRQDGGQRLILSGVCSKVPAQDPLLTTQYEVQRRRRLLRPRAIADMEGAALWFRVDGMSFVDSTERDLLHGMFGPGIGQWGGALRELRGRRCVEVYSGLRAGMGMFAASFAGVPEDLAWRGRVTNPPQLIAALSVGQGWVRALKQQAQLISALIALLGPQIELKEYLALLDSLSGSVFVVAYADPPERGGEALARRRAILRSMRGTVAIGVRDRDAAATLRTLEKIHAAAVQQGHIVMPQRRHRGQKIYEWDMGRRTSFLHFRHQDGLLVAGVGRTADEALKLAAESCGEPATTGVPQEFRELRGAAKLHASGAVLEVLRGTLQELLRRELPQSPRTRELLGEALVEDLLRRRLSVSLCVGGKLGARLRALF